MAELAFASTPLCTALTVHARPNRWLAAQTTHLTCPEAAAAYQFTSPMLVRCLRVRLRLWEACMPQSPAQWDLRAGTECTANLCVFVRSDLPYHTPPLPQRVLARPNHRDPCLCCRERHRVCPSCDLQRQRLGHIQRRQCALPTAHQRRCLHRCVSTPQCAPPAISSHTLRHLPLSQALCKLQPGQCT